MPGSPSVAKRDKSVVGILQAQSLQAPCRALLLDARQSDERSFARTDGDRCGTAGGRAVANAHRIPLVWLGGLPIAAIDRVSSAEFVLNVAIARRAAGGPPP
jgi:hypothetical protein